MRPNVERQTSSIKQVPCRLDHTKITNTSYNWSCSNYSRLIFGASAASAKSERAADSPVGAGKSELPERWELTRGIDLHHWQQQCVDAWFGADKRGVLKVVTGAGKTVLALAIAEKLQQTTARDLRIAIVVPTVVLLNQWKEEIMSRSNLPSTAIGLLGGGSDESFNAETRILICVLNSAGRKLPEIVRKAGVGSSLLLVVDECHRAGAEEISGSYYRAGIFVRIVGNPRT